MISETGVIYRSNNLLAKCFKSDVEDILNSRFHQLFSDASSDIFSEKCRQLGTSGNRELSVEFELPIDNPNLPTRDYLWSLRPYGNLEGNFECLYQVIGQDISLVKEYERLLTNIFSCIPLGILTINQDLCIYGPYSSYLEFLFGTNELQGLSIQDILLRNTIVESQADLQSKLNNLKTCLGSDESWFDSMKNQLPREICLSSEKDKAPIKRWVGIPYQRI